MSLLKSREMHSRSVFARRQEVCSKFGSTLYGDHPPTNEF